MNQKNSKNISSKQVFYVIVSFIFFSYLLFISVNQNYFLTLIGVLGFMGTIVFLRFKLVDEN